jgi:hypothetical protein
MYGQTGSGKTYTMSSVYERAAADLFGLLGGELAATRATLAAHRSREAELEARLAAAAEQLRAADGVAGSAESARVAAESAHAQELAAVLAQVRLVLFFGVFPWSIAVQLPALVSQPSQHTVR